MTSKQRRTNTAIESMPAWALPRANAARGGTAAWSGRAAFGFLAAVGVLAAAPACGSFHTAGGAEDSEASPVESSDAVGHSCSSLVPRPFFCDDFEGSDRLGRRWLGTSVVGATAGLAIADGGRSVLELSAYPDAPMGTLAEPALKVAPQGNFVRSGFQRIETRLQMNLDDDGERVDERTAVAGLGVGLHASDGAGCAAYTFWAGGVPSLVVESFAPGVPVMVPVYTRRLAAKALRPGSWIDVGVAMMPSVEGARLLVSVGGALVDETVLGSCTGTSLMGPDLLLSNAPEGFRLRIDDFAVWLE